MALFSDGKFNFPVREEGIFYQTTIYEIATGVPIKTISYKGNTAEVAMVNRNCRGYDNTTWRIELKQISREDYLELKSRAEKFKLVHVLCY